MGPRDERGGPGRRPGLPARRPGPRAGASPHGAGDTREGDVPAAGGVVGEPDDVAGLRRIVEATRAGGRRRPRRARVVVGVVRRAQVEGSPLVLVADDGTTWELQLPAGWSVDADADARVAVTGDELTDAATTSQVGPVLRVRSLARAD